MKTDVHAWAVWVSKGEAKRKKQIKSEPEERFHQSLVKFAEVPALSLLIALRVSSLIKYGRVQTGSVFRGPHTHTHTHISALLSHEVLVCYQSDFLSQIFISNQSSWLNLKSEPSSINHITCLTPIMPGLISHRNETPPWCMSASWSLCMCVFLCMPWNGKMDVDRAVIWSMQFLVGTDKTKRREQWWNNNKDNTPGSETIPGIFASVNLIPDRWSLLHHCSSNQS